MKELKFTQASQMGLISGTLRIIGKLLFFKLNNSQQAEQIIDKMRKHGAIIEKAKDWIKIDIIRDNQYVKLGDEIINTEEDSIEQIEEKFYNFYKNQYKKLGWSVQ